MIEVEITIKIFKFETSKYQNVIDIKNKLEQAKDKGTTNIIDHVDEIFNTLYKNKVFEVYFLRPLNENEFDKLKAIKTAYEKRVIA